MDLFNFDALVVWLDTARNNLLLAFSEIFLRISQIRGRLDPSKSLK